MFWCSPSALGPLQAQLRGLGFANRQQMAVYDPDIVSLGPSLFWFYFSAVF